MKLRTYAGTVCVLAFLVMVFSSVTAPKRSGGRKSPGGNARHSAKPGQDILITGHSDYPGPETPDAAIYYTLDGSIPAAENGTLYAGLLT